VQNCADDPHAVRLFSAVGLRALDLSHNGIKSLPPEIKELQNLEYLIVKGVTADHLSLLIYSL
jgi:Leucine-rich repeat (LRR) protein